MEQAVQPLRRLVPFGSALPFPPSQNRPGTVSGRRLPVAPFHFRLRPGNKGALQAIFLPENLRPAGEQPVRTAFLFLAPDQLPLPLRLFRLQLLRVADQGLLLPGKLPQTAFHPGDPRADRFGSHRFEPLIHLLQTQTCCF